LGRPLVGGDVSIDLTNYANFQYTGPLWMGSKRELLDVIYDTGSDWLVLDTDFCTDCHDPVFHTRKSSTYEVVDGYLMSQEYGSASVKGYNATDYISVTEPSKWSGKSRCSIEEFPFFALRNQIGIEEDFDGILGLSR
jgi:hypothetical protein